MTGRQLGDAVDRLKLQGHIMHGIGRHLLAMAGLFFLSHFAGMLPGPADPVSMLFFTSVMFPVALISYLAGIWLSPVRAENHRRQKLTITLIAVGLMIVFFIIATVELYRIAALYSDQPVESIEQLFDGSETD